MKKVIALLLILAMTVGMVACTPKGDDSKLALDKEGKGLCPVCNETVQWIKFDGSKMYFEVLDKKHFYLAEDLTYNEDMAALVTTMPGGCVCFNLNGHTLTTGSRFQTIDQSVTAAPDETSVFNLISNGGKVVYTGASNVTLYMFQHNEGFFNFYGGEYVTSFAEGVAVREIIECSRKMTIQDATIKGDMYLDSIRSKVTIKGTTTVDGLIKLVFDERAHKEDYMVLFDNWSGKATLEVPEEWLVDGVLDPTRLSASGDFTGTLMLSTGEQVVLSDGQLVVKK